MNIKFIMSYITTHKLDELLFSSILQCFTLYSWCVVFSIRILIICQGFTIDWCKQPEIGLPKPDLVVYLHMATADLAARGGFGEERYETDSFQARVLQNYMCLKDSSWRVGYF